MPRPAPQRQSRLTNTAHSSSMLPTRQQSAAPACSGRCGAAASPPRPVHGADERRHGLPPAAGGAHFSKEAQDAPAVYAALCSAAHGPRHTKPTLSLAKRLSAEGLAARTRLLRGHALRPGERGAGTQPFLESCVPSPRPFFSKFIFGPSPVHSVVRSLQFFSSVCCHRQTEELGALGVQSSTSHPGPGS